MAEPDVSGLNPAPIRVFIASVPHLYNLSEVISQESDFKVVGHAQSNVELLLSMTAEVDILLLGADQVSPLPGICTHLLGTYPSLRIIVIALHDGTASMYWLRLQQRLLGPVAEGSLLSSIRELYQIDWLS